MEVDVSIELKDIIVSAIRVPQVPVDNQHDVITVYHIPSKLAACSNKYGSQIKNRAHAIQIIEGILNDKN
jgi:protein subunit release factor A